MYGKNVKTVSCKKKGILLDGTQKAHYYEHKNKDETLKKYYESAKRQYCAAYAKTNEEVGEKFGCKESGDRYRRC